MLFRNLITNFTSTKKKTIPYKNIRPKQKSTKNTSIGISPPRLEASNQQHNYSIKTQISRDRKIRQARSAPNILNEISNIISNQQFQPKFQLKFRAFP